MSHWPNFDGAFSFPPQEKIDPEHVALLVKKEWRLSYVTPLYQFRYTMLKMYSRQLAAFLMAEKQQGTAVEVGLEAGFKVTFSTVLGMAETKDDAETVFIQVGPMHYNNFEDVLITVMYTGMSVAHLES